VGGEVDDEAELAAVLSAEGFDLSPIRQIDQGRVQVGRPRIRPDIDARDVVSGLPQSGEQVGANLAAGAGNQDRDHGDSK
jgi:hypothetical protein